MTPLEQRAKGMCLHTSSCSSVDGDVPLPCDCDAVADLLAFAEQVRRETVEEAIKELENLYALMHPLGSNGGCCGAFPGNLAADLDALLAPPAESKEEK